MNFEDAIRLFDNMGIVDVLVPFIIVFTIVFAIFQKTHILGQDKKNYNITIAFAMGFIVVVGHVLSWWPVQSDPVEIMNSALPGVSLLLVGIVMFLLVIGILGGRATWMGGSLSGWIAIVSAIFVIAIFGRAAGWWQGSLPNWLDWLNDSETQALLIIILIFGIVIWFITKEDSPKKKGFELIHNIGDFFKGGK